MLDLTINPIDFSRSRYVGHSLLIFPSNISIDYSSFLDELELQMLLFFK
jgi:hypothetical protein